MADRETILERVDPKIKRIVVLAIFAAVAIGAVVLFSGEPGKPRRQAEQKQSVVKDLLTDTDTGALGVEGLVEQVRKLRAENRRLQEKFEQVEQQSAQERERLQKELQRQSEANAQQIKELVERLEKTVQQQTSRAVQMAEKVAQEQAERAAARPAEGAAGAPEKPRGDEGIRAIFGTEPTIAAGPAPSAAPGKPPRATALAIREFVEKAEEKQEASEGEGDGNDTVFIPAGTIVTGVLLNGIDAGTGRSARKDPQPVLLRVKHEALMPNRFRADIKECAILLSGYGELSSERVYLRTETLTCVREDGGVIEVPVDGYAVGEDGKTGVRGRLVSRQGQYLAKAAIAGFAEGFSKVFSQQPVPVIATTATSTTPFQSALSKEGLQSAALSGAGSALERLSDFYMDMAEEMFPVIEIDGGRRVDIILNRGAKLRIVGL